MPKRIDEFEGDEEEYLKRLGAAVLSVWDELPPKVRTKIHGQTGYLRGGGREILTEMMQFIDRNEGEVE